MDNSAMSNLLRTREYGSSGPWAIVLHGGPGAPGYMAPVARALAGAFRVIEPFQRGGGAQPLTVATHVADLDDLITARCGGERPLLVGHSWGAMLALAHAAARPERVRALALIGCGTFDAVARARLRATCRERGMEEIQSRMERLAEDYPDADARLAAMARLIEPVYSFDLLPPAGEDDVRPEPVYSRAHEETWGDMVRQQEAGVYPAAFSSIRCPAIMFHGAHDPHPGRMIFEGLKPHIPHLEYREFPRCGHDPWRERYARTAFFSALLAWSSRRPK